MMNKKMNRLVLFFVCTISITIIMFNYFLNTNTVKGASNPPIKSYINVSVKPNDTLWDLASEYMNPDYYDHDSYINEIMAINNINNTVIFAGECITFPVVE